MKQKTMQTPIHALMSTLKVSIASAAVAIGLTGCQNFKVPSALTAARTSDTTIRSFAGGPVKILAIGDSITAGDDSHASYRWPLFGRLAQDARNVTFVGPFTCGAINCVPNPMAGQSVAGRTFEVAHGAIWGIRSQTLAENYATTLASYQPDVVLLHLGTNDVFEGIPQHTLANYTTIISALRSQNPHVVIFLAQLIAADGSRNDFNVSLNALIPSYAAQNSTGDSPIVVVDQFSGFDPGSQTTDGLHPNPNGESQMAERWYSAMVPYLAAGPTPQPQPPQPNPQPSPSPTPAPISNGATTIYFHGKCLDVANGSAEAGTPVRLWDCNGSVAQQFVLNSADQTVRTLGGFANVCLDAAGSQGLNGDRLISWPCHGGANQRWQYNASTQQLCGINGACLDVPGGVTGSGTPLQIWKDGVVANQMFTFEPATPQPATPQPVLPPSVPLPQPSPSTPTGVLQNIGSGRCLRIAGRGNGMPVYIHDCNGNDLNESTILAPQADGTVQIQGQEGCVGVTDTTVNGNALLLTCGSSSVNWIPHFDGAQNLSFENAGSHLCLAIQNTSDMSNLVQRACDQSTAQLFRNGL